MERVDLQANLLWNALIPLQCRQNKQRAYAEQSIHPNLKENVSSIRETNGNYGLDTHCTSMMAAVPYRCQQAATNPEESTFPVSYVHLHECSNKCLERKSDIWGMRIKLWISKISQHNQIRKIGIISFTIQNILYLGIDLDGTCNTLLRLHARKKEVAQRNSITSYCLKAL